MKNTSIKIEQRTNEIIVPRSFYKKASIFGTTEYEMLKKVRTAEPDFEVKVREIARNRNKKTYSNLTFKNMARYISIKENSDSPNIPILYKLINASDIQTSRYAYVKSWFLKNYPDYTDPDALLENNGKAHPISEDSSAPARKKNQGKSLDEMDVPSEAA